MMEEGGKEECSGKKTNPPLPDNFGGGLGVSKNNPGECLKWEKMKMG